MAITQHAYTEQNLLPEAFTGAVDSISLAHVSVSQLLGRDYVFIDADAVELPIEYAQRFHDVLNQLVSQLDVVETHTVVVSFNQLSSGQLSFTRHDLTWFKHKIHRVETFTITSDDQQEFMEMIWQCSTPAQNL